MRFRPPVIAAPLLLLALTVHAAESTRELVVQLSSAALRTAGVSSRQPALPAAVRARFAALALVRTRPLTENLAEPLGASRHALPETYGFEPARIVLVEAPDSALAASALIALASDPLVDWVERNVSRSVALVGFGGSPPRGGGVESGPLATASLDTLANDPYLVGGRQYGLRNLGPAGFFGGVVNADVRAIAAWRVSVGSNAIKLAVADTGIDPDQPELGGLMPDGSPRIVDALNVTDEPGGSVVDQYGHGTPVAGVMAARTNNGAPLLPGAGIAGVCGGDGGGNAGCRIVPIKIAAGFSGEATSFDIARALVHAADVGARAMNLSFAGTSATRVERQSLTYALLNGCVPVCAAGNSGFDDPRLALYPAAFARDGLAISVGASDSFDRRTVFSSYPVGLDLLAPGLDVYTTFMTYTSHYGATYPGYVPASGTSFAAPFVTGAVGLLAAARPELIDTDFQHIIRESADDIGTPGFDAPTAYGRLNLQRMLERVRPEIGIWHDETVADSFTVEGEGTLTVGESGSGTTARWFGTHWSTRLAAYATVSMPDSFLRVTGVWLRVGGTLAVRGDFNVPYFAPSASVLRSDDRSATFRGYLYRIQDDSCEVCDDRYVPLAPSNVRFGFTVLGIVDRPPVLALVNTSPEAVGTPGEPWSVAWSVSDPDTVTRMRFDFAPDAGGRVLLGERDPRTGTALFTLPCLSPVDTPGHMVVTAIDQRGHADETHVTLPFTLRGGACSAPLAAFRVTPTPFVSSLGVFAPGAGELRVLDASGRVVRRLATSGGPVHWDGRDERGSATAAGIYWVRYDGPAGTVTKRVVKLGR
jgi:subtilisin family serine protease